MAKELSIHVLATMGSISGYGPPFEKWSMLAELRKWGRLEADADAVWLLTCVDDAVPIQEAGGRLPLGNLDAITSHHERVEAAPRGYSRAEIFVAKQQDRNIGAVDLLFDRRSRVFIDL